MDKLDNRLHMAVLAHCSVKAYEVLMIRRFSEVGRAELEGAERLRLSSSNDFSFCE